MKIAAHVGIKDEVELIERTIAHLRAIGVDLIIACDTCSTDGTMEILESHRSEDGFWLVQIDNETDSLERVWLNRAVELARKSDADWVIFLDADEFWIPATGSLKDCEALASTDAVLVDRFNIPLGPNGPQMPNELVPGRYDELLLFVEPIPDLRTYLEANPDTPWIRGVPMRKVMARPRCVGGLTHGMHDIIAVDQSPVRRAVARDLLIAHLPFTTAGRFARKIDNVRKVFSVHDKYFAGHMAWHWRRWLAMAEAGRTDEEFNRQIHGKEDIAALRDQGVIRTAAEVFHTRIPAGSSA